MGSTMACDVCDVLLSMTSCVSLQGLIHTEGMRKANAKSNQDRLTISPLIILQTKWNERSNLNVFKKEQDISFHYKHDPCK